MKNASPTARARPAWTSTRSGCGTPSTATPSCPCAPRPCWPSPPPGQRCPAPTAVGAGQPAAWRDTGKLPASADDQPPGDDPGLVKVSVPEARRLACLATTPISHAAREQGYTWSRWRRRHQARARWHHYHARLTAAHVT